MGDSLDSLDAEYDPDVIAAAIDIYGDEYDSPANQDQQPVRDDADVVAGGNGITEPTEESRQAAPTSTTNSKETVTGEKKTISKEEEARRLREQYMRMRLAYTKNNYDKLHRAELERQKRVRERESTKESTETEDRRQRPHKDPHPAKKRRFPKLGAGDFKSKLQRLQQLRRNWRARQKAIKESKREGPSNSVEGNETYDHGEEARRRAEGGRRREEEERRKEVERRRESERDRREEEVRRQEERLRREEERRRELERERLGRENNLHIDHHPVPENKRHRPTPESSHASNPDREASSVQRPEASKGHTNASKSDRKGKNVRHLFYHMH